jgi:hypothetical protein
MAGVFTDEASHRISAINSKVISSQEMETFATQAHHQFTVGLGQLVEVASGWPS